jgi:toxin ParE1/3/4
MTDCFEVISTPDAEQDLNEIFEYISTVLLEPRTASNYLKKLSEGIGKLSYQAEITPVIEEEPWHSLAVRKTLIGNFYIYYRVNRNSRTVYILNVIYARRDQLKAFSRKND